MPTLPRFSFRARVTAEDAREDKIEASLSRWFFEATPEDLSEVRDRICTPPDHLRDDPEQFPFYGWLFTRPSFRNSMKLQIRNSRLPALPSAEKAGKPLFTGVCRFQRSEHLINASLHLSLNPLRFIRHRFIPVPHGSQPILTQQETLPSAGGEYSNDGEDNWIPKVPPYDHADTAEQWPQHLRRYIYGIGRAFEDELAGITSSFDGDVSHAEDFSLRKVEVIFEFETRGTTNLVRSLVPVLREYRALDNVAKEYPPAVEGKGACLSFFMGLRQGLALRLYAKTNRRVRFEFIFTNINRRRLLGEPEPAPSSGPHPPRPWSQLFQCLANLREQAADEMNALLQFFGGQRKLRPSPYTALNLITGISTVLQDSELAGDIVDLLISFPAIRRRGASEEIQDALRLLVSRGILRYDSRSRGYVPRVLYREAVSVLKSNPTQVFWLRTTARQRQRMQER